MDTVQVLCHSSIRFNKENKIIYVDPYKIEKEYKDADIVLVTHSHFDHYSEEDIKKVVKENTIILTVKETFDKTLDLGIKKENIIIVKPNMKYNVLGLEIETVVAYNINKEFHPKQNEWVGYIIKFNDGKYYIMGDTDFVEEMKTIECDVLLIPIGGTYTMNVEEAVRCVQCIKPKKVIPTHYGEIVGKYEDADMCKKLVEDIAEVKILINEK